MNGFHGNIIIVMLKLVHVNWLLVRTKLKLWLKEILQVDYSR